jgi:hypothetical protein
VGLAGFTSLALVPFLLGLLIAPLDREGRFLQYYPFRLGDVMLPLNACLLFLCVLQEVCSGKARRWLVMGSLIFLGSVCAMQAFQFHGQLQALRQFPGERQGVDPQWKDLCAWVRQHTPREAVIISPPASLDNFSWLAERATIAKFKLLPPSRAGIMEWHDRLSALSGDVDPWPVPPVTEDRRKAIRAALDRGYGQLSTSRAQELMSKYRSQYLVTRVGHHLDLPVMYRNPWYVVYGLNPEGRS